MQIIHQGFTHKGFTLIELMIVVAIIGILAAVAIPSYQDYTGRSQVTEAVGLSAGFKTGFAEYYADNGRWPSFLTTVGATTAGRYVTSMTISSGAGLTQQAVIITATFRGVSVNTNIANSVYGLGSSDGGRTWACGESTAGPQAATNNLDSKYLPGACK